MQRYFARIIRAFIVSALGFGGGMFLLALIYIMFVAGRKMALPLAFQFALGVGVGFGMFFAALMLLTDLSARLYAAHGVKTDEIWELEQTRQLEYEGSVKDAWVMARKALLAVPAVKSVTDDDGQSMINGSVGASWKSPGEKMQIDISAAGDNKWTIKCTSACLQSNIAFDYGKNFDNVEAWHRKMRAMLESGSLGSSQGYNMPT